MKYIFYILIAIICFASCNSSKSTSEAPSSMNIQEGDTVRIANEELEYEIIIIEPGFNNWLATQPPRGYYGLSYLRNRNIFFVAEYNRRVLNPLQYDIELYQQQIDYSPNIDYGYEVNYLLFNYFVYFQRTFNQDLPGRRI